MSQLINQYFLPWALAFIMFSLGLGLVLQDFSRLLTRPKAILAGLLGQMVLVPCLALLIADQAALPPPLALGFMILAACPGGVSSALITHLARGDTALSISLTALSSLLALFSVPLVINLAARHFTGADIGITLPLGKLVAGIFLLTTFPVIMGMALRHFYPLIVNRWQAATARTSTLLFLTIILATFATQWQAIATHLWTIGTIAIGLNLAVMALGWGLAKTFSLQTADCMAITIECGLQNAALGIYVASTLLQSAEMTLPSVIYALAMNISAIGLIALVRWKKTKHLFSH